MKNTIWITWENQVRNRTMSSILNAKLYEIICHEGRMRRYIYCSVKTILTIVKERPNIVFSQNPSIVLCYLLFLLRTQFKFKLIIDSHYAGIIAANGNRFLQLLLDAINKRVDLVIVTNADHAERIKKSGGRAFICEDPLLDLSTYDNIYCPDDKSVTFICSYDVDEPYKIVFDSATRLKDYGFTLNVTGNYAKVGINPSDYPHVNFLGFLDEGDYFETLKLSAVVVDLTENENCLVCGAYEAMAAERPLVTSNTVCLRRYFTHGAIFTNHNVDSIVNSIITAYECRHKLIEDIILWKKHTFSSQRTRVNDIYFAIS